LVLALGIALFPLGALSLVAAADNYRFVRGRQVDAAKVVLTRLADRYSDVIRRDEVALRLAIASGDRATCVVQLGRLLDIETSLAGILLLDNNGNALCVAGSGWSRATPA